jgi:hypothetical protein
MSIIKRDGLLVSHRHCAVFGHGRVALFLNLCAVPDVQSERERERESVLAVTLRHVSQPTAHLPIVARQ